MERQRAWPDNKDQIVQSVGTDSIVVRGRNMAYDENKHEKAGCGSPPMAEENTGDHLEGQDYK